MNIRMRGLTGILRLVAMLLVFQCTNAATSTGVIVISSLESDMPIYVDDVFIGYTPIEHAIIVSEGWHTVGIFKTSQIPEKTPTRGIGKTSGKLINSGIKRVYVPADEVVEVQLSGSEIGEEIFRKTVRRRNIFILVLGFSLLGIIAVSTI